MALCRSTPINLFAAWLSVLAIAGATVTSDVKAQELSKLTSIIDWSLYIDSQSPHAFCFLTSAPKSSSPTSDTREHPRVYISAWPQEGVKAEPSVTIGFVTKKGSDITAAIGAQSFTLFADKERAFVADATNELKFVEAMRKGSKLAITATDSEGKEITDTYSLAGVGQAMQELQSTCF